MNSVETDFRTPVTAGDLKDALDQFLYPRQVIVRPRRSYMNTIYRGWRIYNMFDVNERASMAMAIVADYYPNRRVVWLADHHPKERVRKKNYRRIFKWAERQGIL
ncbi:MAG: hypothetical protein IKR49_06555 [Clostridia bacterium]|nr:hypothetical protein [Clostridia bacterium]